MSIAERNLHNSEAGIYFSKLLTNGLPFQEIFDDIEDNIIMIPESEIHVSDSAEDNELYLIHYPQKVGNPLADQAVKVWVNSEINSAWGYICTITYKVFRPSPRYLSIAFCKSQNGGGFHGEWQWTVLNFDLASGRALTLENIFPDMDYSAPLLERYIAQQFVPEHLQHLAQRRASGLPIAEEDSHPLFYPLDMKIERLVLAADGLRVIYSVYEQGGFVEGDKIAKISLADIPQLGGVTTCWQ